MVGPRKPGAMHSTDPRWRPAPPVILDDDAAAREIAERWVAKSMERRTAALRARLT